MYFEMAFTSYLENSCLTESCDNKLQQLIEVKKRCNDLRRLISIELYTEMLIPDHRGDVLRLIQDLYSLIDDITDDFQELLIEKTEILPGIRQEFLELTAMVVKSIENVIQAARTYFRDPMAVRDRLHKVSFYETEADQIALRLKKKIFESVLPLENKLQLRDAVSVIDDLANKAEDVSEWLAIYALKRAL